MESLGPRPLGRSPHLLLRALRRKGLQHPNDAEGRSALLRFIKWQKKTKQLQSGLQRACCWMTNKVCELQPLLQGWKWTCKMHQTFSSACDSGIFALRRNMSETSMRPLFSVPMISAVSDLLYLCISITSVGLGWENNLKAIVHPSWEISLICDSSLSRWTVLLKCPVSSLTRNCLRH